MKPKRQDKSKRVAVRLDTATHRNFKKLCADMETSIEARLLSHIAKDLRKNQSVLTASNQLG